MIKTSIILDKNFKVITTNLFLPFLCLDAGFALDDVRRPVYRGNVRYKRYFYNTSVHRPGGDRMNESLLVRLNSLSRSRRDTNNSPSGTSTSNTSSSLNNRKLKKISTHSSIDADRNWSLVSLATSISDQNHTRSLVRNFLSNSLQHLQSTTAYISPGQSSTVIKTGESLDNLILSHTQHGVKPIQMYPEGSPPNWHTNPVDPTVILIEDVHPSKLPKPPTTPSSHLLDDVWNHPNNKPLHYKPVEQMFPVQVEKRPKPSAKPSYNWGNVVSTSGNTGYRPQEDYSATGEIQPVLLYPRPGSSSKPTSKPKPYVVKPLHHYTATVTQADQSVHHSLRPSIPTNTYSNGNNHWNDPPAYKPPYNLVRPTRPVYQDPPAPASDGPSSEPVYKPVYTFPRPTKPPVSKPPHSSPRPPELHNHYYDPPPLIHNTSKYPPVLIAQSTVLPVTEPTNVRPPPPSIIVIDSASNITPPPAAAHDCGSVQVINNFSKEPPYPACSDVMILVNSPVTNSASSSAAAAAAAAGSGAAGGGGVAATLGGIAAVSHTVALAAGSAAAGGAAGAAAAGAAAAGAAGSAGAAAASGAAAGSAGAAAAAAAAAGVAGSAGSAIPPILPVDPPALVPPVSTPPQATPVLHPLDDEEEDYDYDDLTTSAPPKPMKPMKPSMGYITTFLESVNAFINTLPILGPISVSLWIILLGPLLFLLVGLMGVGTFLLPWIGPSIILGGRRRRSIVGRHRPTFSHSAITFERNLKLGLLDNYYRNLE